MGKKVNQSERIREALGAHWSKGLAVKAIAEKLGVKVGLIYAIKARKNKGKKKKVRGNGHAVEAISGAPQILESAIEQLKKAQKVLGLIDQISTLN